MSSSVACETAMARVQVLSAEPTEVRYAMRSCGVVSNAHLTGTQSWSVSTVGRSRSGSQIRLGVW